MLKQPWVSFQLAGVSLTDFGLMIPSPFCSLELSNSEVTSMTSWTLKCVIAGDSTKKSNVAAFEALLYSAAQATSAYSNASGIPVSFSFGWLNSRGQISEYISYQGFTLQFKVSTNGMTMTYTVTGFAKQAMQSSSPVLRIPAVNGLVQPSAVVEALAIGTKAVTYYELDIDHNDAPTYISHGPLTTSFNSYVRGSYSGEDDFESFPGLLKLSKSYNGSREAAGLTSSVNKLSQVINNVLPESRSKYLKTSTVDTAPQCASFSYWVDEPTMTQPGVIHYKSNAGLQTSQAVDTLCYGTANSNVLTVSGSYNGVAYNMKDMRFASVGFTLDCSGETIIQNEEVVNSWSATLGDVYQSVNIINDVNAISTQFSGDFNVQIPGSLKKYSVAQPISLLVMSGNSVSPISGVYNIMSVTHTIGNTFITSLKLQRLALGSANQVATSQGIFVSGSGSYLTDKSQSTSNIINPYKVDFGQMYPTWEHMYTGL